MAVGFSVDIFFYEAGHPDFLHSFFSTISYHTEPEGWGTKYPLLMQDLYFKKLNWKDAPEALRNVEEIRGVLNKLSPSEVVWDIENVSKQPPWKDKIPNKITSLANYHMIQGTIFLDLLKHALEKSAEYKVDVIEQEILEQIRELERMIAEVQSMSAHMSGMDALLQVYYAMKRKLEDKLERLYQFNVSSSDNYATAMALAANIAKGLAEVQSGKGFSPASGTFSTKELNMDWATSIHKITEDKARQAEKLEAEKLIEEEESEKSLLEKAWDTIYYGSGQAAGYVIEGVPKIWNGIYIGSGQVVGGVIEGFPTLFQAETWLNAKDAIINYDETIPAMWNTLSDSFIRDVINGDAESIARWGTTAFMQVAGGGVLSGAKGVMGASKVSKISKVTEITVPRLQPSFAGGGVRHGENPLNNYYMFARPSWRKSELDAGETFSEPKYTDQASFKDREEVPYGKKGSTRPDFFSYEEGKSIEVKNYNVTTPRGRKSLINVIVKQFEDRIKHLPEGTKQTVLIDVRGQTVTKETLKQIKEEITQRTFGQMEIIIRKDSN